MKHYKTYTFTRADKNWSRASESWILLALLGKSLQKLMSCPVLYNCFSSKKLHQTPVFHFISGRGMFLCVSMQSLLYFLLSSLLCMVLRVTVKCPIMKTSKLWTPSINTFSQTHLYVLHWEKTSEMWTSLMWTLLPWSQGVHVSDISMLYNDISSKMWIPIVNTVPFVSFTMRTDLWDVNIP